MPTLRRLNMDTTWALAWNGTSMLIDPWLIGSEVDGFSWFNEQWHATAPVPVGEIGDYDFIIISQSYSDHCHRETVLALNEVPLIVSPSAAGRVRKEMLGRSISLLPELKSGQWHQQGQVELAYLDPGRKIDPIYNGIVIRHADECIIYFPHGFFLKEAHIELLKAFRVRALITSFSRFKLPFFLGGAVNPGTDNALELVRQLNPELVLHTHDENKHARGLVKKLARVTYPDMEHLEKTLPGKFIYSQYEPLSI